MDHNSRFHILIDRESSVPIGLQIKGQIEYGIAGGDLPLGAQLPPVRDLAAELKVSPVTISQAYGALQREGLLSAQAGRGTFVAESPGVRIVPGQTRHLETLMDRLVAEARRLGLGDEQLRNRLSAYLSRYAEGPGPVRVALVGLFEGATRAYLEALRAMLDDLTSIEWFTFERLKDPKQKARLGEFDLLVTFPYHLIDLKELAPREIPVAYLRFLPSEHTRISLAELDPRSRLLAVSTFHEFLPTLKSGLERFAPHVGDKRFATLDDSRLNELVQDCRVVVYATGSESVRELLPLGIRAFEYRHAPDAAFVEEYLAPIIRKLRAGEPIVSTL